MILKILDKSKNALVGLDDVQNLKIESSTDFSDQMLSFDVSWRLIEDVITPEGYIETKTDRYVIKEIGRRKMDGMASVFAALDLEDLEGKAILNFESVENTISACLALALASTTWTVASSTVTKKRTVRLQRTTALDVIKQALKTYRCEVIINSKAHTLSIVETVGEDRGVYFKDDLNLKELNVKSQSYDFFTEIEPYGKDGLTIETVNGGSVYLSNYNYSSKHKRLIWVDERYTIAQSLKDDAEAKLAELAAPIVSYEAEVADLARMSSAYGVLDYALGDTVTIIDSVTGTREKQRIVRMELHPNEPWLNTCTIANRTLSFSDLAAKYDTAADTVDNVTSDNGTLRGSTLDGVYTRQIIDLENGLVNSATITNLSTDLLTVTTRITAVEGEFGTLSANVANFETATAQNFEAVNGRITTLETQDLTAATARISILEGDSANIKSILAGNIGTGDLQTVHLTALNAVIDDALISNQIVRSQTVQQLLARDIITNTQRIISNDGSFIIDGSTLTVYDENDVARIQLGKDANDDFTFTLFDATGQGVLIDASGIKENAIADGLIKNSKVAADANISATKLDVASLFSVINGSENVINAYRIYFDEQNLSLNQVYSQLSTSLSTVESGLSTVSNTAAQAATKADAATEAANAATRALEGISSLDNLSAWLENDAHVVHTFYDGNGGNYADAYTVVHAVRGDTDVTAQAEISVSASASVVGTWDRALSKYQVTNLTDDDGYVDFTVAYGTATSYLVLPGDHRLVLPGDHRLVIPSGTTEVKKRFSISKSPDGQVGLSIKIIADPAVVRKMENGDLSPATVTFSALQTRGEASPTAFAGFWTLEESTDGSTFTVRYTSSSAESEKTIAPSYNAKMLRATLRNASAALVDRQTVTVIADVDELRAAVNTATEGVLNLATRMGSVESGIDGLTVNLAQTNEEISGITNGVLMWAPYISEETETTVKHTARVYDAKGNEITANFPACWFSWKLKTETGIQNLGTGVNVTVSKAAAGYGGSLMRIFQTFDERRLVLPGEKTLVFPDQKRLSVYIPAA